MYKKLVNKKIKKSFPVKFWQTVTRSNIQKVVHENTLFYANSTVLHTSFSEACSA